MDQNESFNSDFTTPSKVYNIAIVRSQREIELEDMLSRLNEKFSTLQINDPQKLSNFTIAPEARSLNKIAKEFSCSRRIAKKAKDLRISKGVLPYTTAKTIKPLLVSTVDKIKDFYTDDANSITMPSPKDVVSVKIDKNSCLMHKRLLLLDLRGLYDKYKESYPEFPVCFSFHFCWAQRNPFRLRLHDPSEC